MRRFSFLALGALLSACNTTTTTSDAAISPDAGSGDGGSVASNQTPPMGEAALEAWLATTPYTGTGWHCESATHPGRTTSPHGIVRTCVNDALFGAASTGELPVGAATVKELYDNMNHVVGHAVMRRTAAGAAPANWYFYERVPAGTMVAGITISPTGVVADGPGNAGQSMTVCVGCHTAAAHDFVFTDHPM